METGRQSERLWLSGRQIQSHRVRFGGDRCSSNGSAVAREIFRRHSRMAGRGGTMKMLTANFRLSTRVSITPAILFAAAMLMAKALPLFAAEDENNSATNRMDGTSQTRRGRFGGPERGVYKAQITPHWFQENTRFWYRNDLRDGAKEFIVVDAEHGTRKPAFDHQKLAASLSKATGKEFKPDKLPFSEIEFVHRGTSIQFEAVDNGWRCDLSTYECLAQNASASKPAKTNSSPPAENESKSPADEEISPHADADAAGQGPDQTRGSRRRGGAQAQRRSSPDNKRTAFVKDHNIYLHSESEGKDFQLTENGKEGNSYGRLEWSPDSKGLIAWRTESGDHKEVYLVQSTPSAG